MDKKIVDVNELHVEDIPIVGGKGANLGELTNAGFPVPEAFVLTTAAYDYFIQSSDIMAKIESALEGIDRTSDDSLMAASDEIRAMFEECEIPEDLKKEIVARYRILFPKGKKGFVAVRSSATAEDLPDASFAGQQETYLNVGSEEDLFDKIRKCWSSLFTARAIAYREKQGFAHSDVKLAVVVQRMVNSEFSGIMFTVDPNSGAKQIVIEAGYGLGEAIVGGEVTPDTYVIDKQKMEILKKRISTQHWKYVRGENGGVVKQDMPADMVKSQKIPDDRIQEIAEIGRQIEIHYEKPMDMEWCVEDDKAYIVQARPITATGNSATNESAGAAASSEDIIATGLGASPGLATGRVIIYDTSMSLDSVKEGDVLVTEMTMPDMVPAMSRAAAIVTDEGGMTCHAAIISRELGTPCVVGTGNATEILKDGMEITVDGTTGTVYKGALKKASSEPQAQAAASVCAEYVPITGTKVMVNMSMPAKAEEVAMLQCDGVGLMRSEFLFTNYIGEHPCAVIEEGRSQELIDKLAEGIAKVCRAFYPRPITLRTSDFKTNEYRDMKGGADYEPNEDNPMIGWRGCSRYVSDSYREAFMCELDAPVRQDHRGGRGHHRDDEVGRSQEGQGLQALLHGRDPGQHLHGRRVLQVLRLVLDRVQRPHAAHHGMRQGFRHPRTHGLLRREERGRQEGDRPADQGRPRERQARQHLRPGPVRLPRVHRVPGGAGDRLHLPEPRHVQQDQENHRVCRAEDHPQGPEEPQEQDALNPILAEGPTPSAHTSPVSCL